MLPPLTAEGVVGAAFSVIHARLLEHQPEPLTGLLSRVDGDDRAALPRACCRGAGARVRSRQSRPALLSRHDGASAPARRVGDQSRLAGFRPTFRTQMVLAAVAELVTGGLIRVTARSPTPRGSQTRARSQSSCAPRGRSGCSRTPGVTPRASPMPGVSRLAVRRSSAWAPSGRAHEQPLGLSEAGAMTAQINHQGVQGEHPTERHTQRSHATPERHSESLRSPAPWLAPCSPGSGVPKIGQECCRAVRVRLLATPLTVRLCARRLLCARHRRCRPGRTSQAHLLRTFSTQEPTRGWRRCGRLWRPVRVESLSGKRNSGLPPRRWSSSILRASLLSPPSPFGSAHYSGVAVNPTNGDVYVLGEEGGSSRRHARDDLRLRPQHGRVAVVV